MARCGLDVGISTTDAVADWAPEVSVSLPTADPRTTAEAALRRLFAVAPPPAAPRVAATGVGSRRLPPRLLDCEVRRIEEFSAIGRGGARLAGVEEALVVSLGTGTAMVSVRGDEMSHVVPGSAVGGGTLLGLGRALLGVDDVPELAALAASGNGAGLDLTIGDVVGGPLGALPPSAVAASLAKLGRDAAAADVADALFNLVTEVALEVSLLGLQVSGQPRAVLIGRLLLAEPVRRHALRVAEGMGGLFVVPERPELATALGALWTLELEEGDR